MEISFDAIGTHWTIQSDQKITPALLNKIQRRTDKFDAAYSRFRPDSLVTAMSKKAGSYELPADGFALLQFYEDLYKATDGLVTPLIGQVMSDAGYDAEYSLKGSALTQPPKWQDVITYDKQYIEVVQPVLLDFGATGKGYLVDIIGDILTRAGLQNFVINASGDILQHTNTGRAISVGLENPNDTSEAVGIVKLRNQSLCASAGNKRKWGKFHHIINPDTLQPVDDIIATWVVADSTMLADGLATALFFVEPAQLQKFSFSYAVLHKDMSLSYSKDFPLQIFEATRG